MSGSGSWTASSTLHRDDWNVVLAQLRADGFTPAEVVKITRAVLHVPVGEAKVIVHSSAAWADRRDDFDALHEAAAELP